MPEISVTWRGIKGTGAALGCTGGLGLGFNGGEFLALAIGRGGDRPGAGDLDRQQRHRAGGSGDAGRRGVVSARPGRDPAGTRGAGAPPAARHSAASAPSRRPRPSVETCLAKGCDQVAVEGVMRYLSRQAGYPRRRRR